MQSALWGAREVPAVTGSDMLLRCTLEYFGAFLNAYGVEGWNEVAPGAPVVASVHDYNPDKWAFSESRLPGLFMWRARMEPPEQTTQSWRTRATVCTLMWVPSPAGHSILSLRASFMNAMWATLERAVEQMRDPVWLVDGDPDPTAQQYGSKWPKHAGWMEFTLETAQPNTMTIELESGESRVYDVVEIPCRVVELLTPLPATSPSAVQVSTQSLTGSTLGSFQKP